MTMSWTSTYFLPEEVSMHNSDRDCWLTIHGVVKNVTGLIEEFRNTDLVSPILREAGQDVSYWFELDGVKPVLKTYLHPETGARVSVLPFKIPHEPNFQPEVGWMPVNANFPVWWQDEKYNIGMETVRPIDVRVMNPLIKRSATIKICLEDTIRRIMQRYLAYNPEVSSYTVKYLGKPLRMNLNLSQNGVTLKHDDAVDDYVPTLVIQYEEKLAPCLELGP